jgi:Tol biopolymer transport system component
MAYDVPQPGSSDRDIAVRDLTAGTEQTVIRHRANDLHPVWMPDGKRLVFASDRTGAMGVWKVAMDRGLAAGDPGLVHANIGRSVLIGLSVTGALYLSQSSGAPGDDWETWVLEHALPAALPGRRF